MTSVEFLGLAERVWSRLYREFEVDTYQRQLLLRWLLLAPHAERLITHASVWTSINIDRARRDLSWLIVCGLALRKPCPVDTRRTIYQPSRKLATSINKIWEETT